MKNKLRFTERSQDDLTLVEAVSFSMKQGAVLQSAREAALYRAAYGSEGHELTRTWALYFKHGGEFYVAIDDTSDTSNIMLTRSREGYEVCKAKKLRKERKKKGRDWILGRTDGHVEHAILRAENDGRIHPVGFSQLELATSNEGASEFGSHPIVKSLLGDAAESYAAFLHNKGQERGLVNIPAAFYLERDLSPSNVMVMPVVLGVFNHFSMYGLLDEGVARGVYGKKR